VNSSYSYRPRTRDTSDPVWSAIKKIQEGGCKCGLRTRLWPGLCQQWYVDVDGWSTGWGSWGGVVTCPSSPNEKVWKCRHLRAKKFTLYCAAPPTAGAGQYATSNCRPLLFGFPCKWLGNTSGSSLAGIYAGNRLTPFLFLLSLFGKNIFGNRRINWSICFVLWRYASGLLNMALTGKVCRRNKRSGACRWTGKDAESLLYERPFWIKRPIDQVHVASGTATLLLHGLEYFIGLKW